MPNQKSQDEKPAKKRERNGACQFCTEPIPGYRGTRGPPKEMHDICRKAHNDLDRLHRSINAVMISRETDEGRVQAAMHVRESLQSIRNSDLTPVIHYGRKGKADPRKRKRASPKKRP